MGGPLDTHTSSRTTVLFVATEPYLGRYHEAGPGTDEPDAEVLWRALVDIIRGDPLLPTALQQRASSHKSNCLVIEWRELRHPEPPGPPAVLRLLPRALWQAISASAPGVDPDELDLVCDERASSEVAVRLTSHADPRWGVLEQTPQHLRHPPQKVYPGRVEPTQRQSSVVDQVIDTITNASDLSAYDLHCIQVVVDERYRRAVGESTATLSQGVLHGVDLDRVRHVTPDAFFEFFDSAFNDDLMSRAKLIELFQDWLYVQQGKSFGTAEANKQFAANVQQRAKRLSLRFRCRGAVSRHRAQAAVQCGVPANFRCLKIGDSPNGQFFFGHSRQGQETRHGWSATVPLLELVPPGKDSRLKTLS